MAYDSTVDAKKHIANIHWVYDTLFRPVIETDIAEHDHSKLNEPEKSCYDKYIPELRKYKYGTPEYKEVRARMRDEGLNHHYEMNRHHPEHFENGCEDMNLVDLCCMIIDWYAASLVSDTNFVGGVKKNVKNYNIPPMLEKIMLNTAKDIFKDRKPTAEERTKYTDSITWTQKYMEAKLAEFLKDKSSITDAAKTDLIQNPKGSNEK